MTASALLRQAKALIADERNWWDGRSDADNVFPGKRCAGHAVDCVHRHQVDHRNVYAYLQKAAGGGSIIRFNDTHTHAEVLAAFDRAIGLAERDEAAGAKI